MAISSHRLLCDSSCTIPLFNPNDIIVFSSNSLFHPQISQNQSHLIKQMPEARIHTDFRHFNPLFKLAEFGLIQVISIWLSIPFCIDNPYLFHTLFFVSHLFSTNPVPLHFFIIMCSSGGLQVLFTIHRIILCRFAFPPMEIIISGRCFCN